VGKQHLLSLTTFGNVDKDATTISLTLHRCQCCKAFEKPQYNNAIAEQVNRIIEYELK
jgi:hypothetical protein